MTNTSGTPVSDSGPVTLGEVYRYGLAFEARTMKRFQELDDRLSEALAQTVPREVWTIEHMDLEARMTLIEGAKRDRSNFERALMVALVGSVTTGIADLVFRLVA